MLNLKQALKRGRQIRNVSWNGSYHSRVCWATNEMVGRHPRFNVFPDPRLPSAALLSEYGKQSWRRLGARKPRLWKNARRRKYNIDYPAMPQRYEELCEFCVTLVEHDELMPQNYVRFHIPREMTKYELFHYLDKLYDVKMSHIELEASLPVVFTHYNPDHPTNRDAEEYPGKFYLHDGNSPDYYQMAGQGYGWADEGAQKQHILRETEGYCVAHCYLPAGETFQFPDLFPHDHEGPLEMAANELKEDGFFIRSKLKLDEEGDADHLAMKAFANLNFFAQINPNQYKLDPFHEEQNKLMEGAIEDQKKSLNADLKKGDFAAKARAQKNLDIITETEDLKKSMTEFGNEINDSIKIIQGYKQKGQETYRNRNKYERTRPVNVSVFCHSDAPIPEIAKEMARDTFPMTVERMRHLLQNETPKMQRLSNV